jgi:DNA-binding beta-propeller fold protein YncE
MSAKLAAVAATTALMLALASGAQARAPRDIYILDTGKIVIFHKGKVSEISGKRTRLGAAVAIARQAQGDLVVANRPDNDSDPGTLVTLPPRKGNTGAEFVVACHGFSPWGIGVDAASNIWAADYESDTVRAFAADAQGCPAPVATISGPHTLLDGPQDVVIDGKGRIIVANYLNGLRVYAPGASGDAVPIAVIPLDAAHVEGLAVDADDHIWISEYVNQKVVEYEAGGASTAPLRTIAGPHTGLSAPIGLAVDRASGEIYVCDFAAHHVAVFAPGATGDTAPVRLLDGGGAPMGVALRD